MTDAAFDQFRAQHGPAWGPRHTRDPSESELLDDPDQLSPLIDGAAPAENAIARMDPISADGLPVPRRLWVVREADVVHAEEECAFGKALASSAIKHTNLTGGGPAFSGGEFLMLPDDTLVVSGDSGRYGPRTADEMQDVAIAFRNAGYTVYSTGYDQEANRAFPLVGPAPKLI